MSHALGSDATPLGHLRGGKTENTQGFFTDVSVGTVYLACSKSGLPVSVTGAGIGGHSLTAQAAVVLLSRGCLTPQQSPQCISETQLLGQLFVLLH